MVDETHPPDPPALPPPDEPEPNSAGWRWVMRLIITALGLTAVVNFLRRRAPTGGPAAPVPAPPMPATVPVPLGDNEEVHYADGRIEHPLVHYERRDVSFGWVLGLIIGTIGLAFVLHYVVWVFLLRYLGYESAIKKLPPDSMASVPVNGPPREPRLEQIERVEGNATADVFRRMEVREEALNSYGLLPDEKGYVHIPIDEAIRLLANKLPVRKGRGAEGDRRANGLLDWGESNSGRLFGEKAPWHEH
jgi:hypothetical protein